MCAHDFCIHTADLTLHSVSRPMFNCDMCGKKGIANARSLKLHMLTDHSPHCILKTERGECLLLRDTSDQKFHCPGCDYIDTKGSNVIRHVASHPDHMQPTAIPLTSTGLSRADFVEPIMATPPSGSGNLLDFHELGCTVNKAHGLLICNDSACGIALEPHSIEGHLQGHGHELAEADIPTLVSEYSLVGSKAWLQKQRRPIAHVEGVKVVQGRRCLHKDCQSPPKCYATVRAMIDHCKAAHNNRPYQSISEACHVQSVFGHPKHYQPISLPHPPLDLFLAAKHSVPDSGHRSFEGLQDPELGPFLQRTHWHKFLLGIQNSVSLFDFHQQCHAHESEHPNLMTAVEIYVETTSKLIMQSSTLHRRWLNTKGDGTHE